MAKPDLSDYVDVAERLQQFFAQYPDGSLQSDLCAFQDLPDKDGEIKPHIIYRASAYRTPDDPRPGQGMASEPLPGFTPYTKGSELMNAETSAWGRALAAIGFAGKKVASANEVRNRQTEDRAPKPQRRKGPAPSEPSKSDLPNDAPEHKPVTAEDVKDVFPEAEELIGAGELETLVNTVRSKGLTLEQLRGALSRIGAKVPAKEIFTKDVGIEVMKGLTVEQYGQLNNELDKLTKPKAA